MMNAEQGQAMRTQRAMEIAKRKRIIKRGPTWIVPSQSHSGSYVVTTSVVHGMPTWECSCPDYASRGGQSCKHCIAVEIVRHHEMPDGSVVTETLKVTYSQDWPKYNAAQVQEKERFELLLRDLCKGIAQPPQAMGRKRLPLADMVFSAAQKVYSTQSGRRAQTDVRASRAKGLIDSTPSYNSLFRFMESSAITPLLKSLVEVSAAPLASVEVDFAVDSTGFATKTYKRWFDHKWGKERSEVAWLKAHLTCGVKTNIVSAIYVGPEASPDCPEMPGLLDTTAKRFRIGEVSADKAYLSHENVEKVVALGGMPYIPFKIGTGEGAGGSKLWQSLYHFFRWNNDKFMAHYHKRSNVETTFHMIKSKFGASVRSKSYDAQVNEVYLKALCHNVVVLNSAVLELGIEPQFAEEIGRVA